IVQFLALQRASAEALEGTRADVFVHGLIERLGLRRHHLFTARPDVVERLLNLARLGELAGEFSRRSAGAGAREFARYAAVLAEAGIGEEEALAPPSAGPAAVVIAPVEAVAGLEFDHVFVTGLHAGAEAPSARARRLAHVAMTRAARGLVLSYAAASPRGAERAPSPLAEEARAALSAEWEERDEEPFGPAEALHSRFRERRDELLSGIARLGTRLRELRFDTDLDVAHGVVRYLELVKLAALMARRDA